MEQYIDKKRFSSEDKVMTQEYIKLLLQDLCARWPYNNLVVRVTDMNDPSYQEEGKLRDIKYMDIDCNGIPFLFDVENVFTLCDITEIKPYLRPMSNMTEEESKEYRMFIDYSYNDFTSESTPCVYVDKINDYLNWLNAHSFDYRGLIPKGLALEASEKMYKKEK